MALALLRVGVRSAISRGILEKRGAQALSCSLFASEQNAFRTENAYQYAHVAKRMYSKRNVHHTRASASVNEDSDSDSDSDDEHNRGESQFWRRKMRTLHSHLDVNKDGVISYDDFMLLGERFADLGHLSPAAKEEFEQVLRDMWVEQWGEISPYNLVSVEKYLEEMHHVLNDTSLKRKCHHFLPFLFKAVDKDGSGEISVQEFKLFFQCLGLSHDHAVVSFTFIDTNEDGKISFKEFVKLGRDYILSDDPTRPSKHFWGPLVE
ncbi:sarcoplasmic calcium-binding protein [Cephus cinctus]|uniref:Sarcoplasmic calcium-binding protein n=1 Tax=Cephus cinctus TaxID=211228 RepID=A0AAJ7C1Z7_CEPCN|nr:sarcoplasmic calcium-binding protein [Cephus cinctus]